MPTENPEIVIPPLYIAYAQGADELALDINHELCCRSIDTWIDFEKLPPNESNLHILRLYLQTDKHHQGCLVCRLFHSLNQKPDRSP